MAVNPILTEILEQFFFLHLQLCEVIYSFRLYKSYVQLRQDWAQAKSGMAQPINLPNTKQERKTCLGGSTMFVKPGASAYSRAMDRGFTCHVLGYKKAVSSCVCVWWYRWIHSSPCFTCARDSGVDRAALHAHGDISNKQ